MPALKRLTRKLGQDRVCWSVPGTQSRGLGSRAVRRVPSLTVEVPDEPEQK